MGLHALVSELSSCKNLILNGNLQLWRHGTAIPWNINVYNASYAADRFSWSRSLTSAQGYYEAGDSYGASNSFRVRCSSGNSLGSSDYNNIMYVVEGYDYTRLVDECATLSFWIKGVAGTYAITFGTGDNSWVYRIPLVVNQTNVWEFKEYPVLFDRTSAHGCSYTNGAGIKIAFGFGSGTGYQSATINQWHNSSVYGISGMSNLFSTTGNAIQVSRIQLELGKRFTQFESRPFSMEQDLCSRYYLHFGYTEQDIVCRIQSSTNLYFGIHNKKNMRTAPNLFIDFNKAVLYTVSGNIYAVYDAGSPISNAIGINYSIYSSTPLSTILYASIPSQSPAFQPCLLDFYYANGLFRFDADF